MKNCIFFMFMQLTFTVNFESAKSPDIKIYSTSPIGPYNVIFKDIYSCNPMKSNKIQINWYLSHKGNKTIIIGNSTGVIPFDDTLFLDIKLALKDAFGRWRENSFMQKWPRACSTFKQLLGNEWNTFSKGLGLNHTNCPIPPGFYTASGVDTSIFKNSNLPKTFLYGTYKFYIYFSQKNEIFGCQVFILELKRP